MSEPDKSIWTRHHYLPNLSPLFVRLVSPRMLRRYFFDLVCLATLLALFYAEEDLRGKLAWESYMRQSKANGVELDWHAYVPPPVPDDKNFAMTPPFDGLFNYERTTTNTLWRDTNIWERMARFGFKPQAPASELGGWVRGRPLDLKKWQAYFRDAKSPDTHGGRVWDKAPASRRLEFRETNDWPVAAQPQKPANDVLLALTKLDPDLAAIRAASARPQSRFPIHYDELPNAMITHLGFLANIAKVLQLRAVAELEAGDNQQAFADANLAFYCADAIKSDACLVSQVLRYEMIEDDLQPIWEGLAAHRWSESQLKEFQRYFSAMDMLSQYEQSVKAELAFICGWIEFLPRDPSSFFITGRIPQYFSESQAAMIAHMLPSGWIYQNELYAARFFREKLLPDVAPQTQRVYPSLSRTNLTLFDKAPGGPYTFAFKQIGDVVSPQGFARIQTEINLAVVACALERFRMANGKFPETLDALAPEFLEKLPHDIINGQPLRYRLAAGGRFILYSVGWNEKDDGGTYRTSSASNSGGLRGFSEYHPETGDWVWQYPAFLP